MAGEFDEGRVSQDFVPVVEIIQWADDIGAYRPPVDRKRFSLINLFERLDELFEVKNFDGSVHVRLRSDEEAPENMPELFEYFKGLAGANLGLSARLNLEIRQIFGESKEKQGQVPSLRTRLELLDFLVNRAETDPDKPVTYHVIEEYLAGIEQEARLPTFMRHITNLADADILDKRNGRMREFRFKRAAVDGIANTLYAAKDALTIVRRYDSASHTDFISTDQESGKDVIGNPPVLGDILARSFRRSGHTDKASNSLLNHI